MNTDIDVNKQEIVNKNGNHSKIGGTNIFGLNCHRLTQKTALFIAVENENLEIIQLLLSNDKIDVNIQNIESIEYTNQNGNKTTIIIKEQHFILLLKKKTWKSFNFYYQMIELM